MTDKEFLQWLYNRLQFVFDSHPSNDWMIRFKKIIDAMEDK